MRRHFTASMLVIDPVQRDVLLVHHKAMDLWVFPGGHVDELGGQMELLHEAALREVREETGVKAELWMPDGPRELAGQTWLPSPWITSLNQAPAKPARSAPDGTVKPAEEPHQHIDFLFIGTADSRPLPAEPPADEARGVRWVHCSEVWKLDIRGEVLDLMWEALSRMGQWSS